MTGKKAWTYGKEGLAFPVRPGDVWTAGPHTYVCSDVMESTLLLDVAADLPSAPTVVYTDPPWGQALANGFRTKAGLERATYHWLDLYRWVRDVARGWGVPLWAEASKIESKDGSQVPAAIGWEGCQFRYAPITYNRDVPCGLFYVHTDPPPPRALSAAQGSWDWDTPRLVLDHYVPGLVVDPFAGRGQTSRMAVASHPDWRTLSNELNPHRLSAALSRVAEQHTVQRVRTEAAA